MDYELDRDTHVERAEDGRYRTTISDGWSIGNAPNGGYLSVIAVKCIGALLPQPDPFSVTTHFLATARPGPAQVLVEVVREGKGHSTGMARMIQEDREILRTIAIFGDLTRTGGPTHVTATPPSLPAPELCERGRAGPTTALSIADRVDVAMRPGDVSWMPSPDGTPRAHSNSPELAGWVAFRDGRPIDTTSLVFLADAMPPPVLNLEAVRTPWVPTLELTVHVRARPAPGRIAARFTTRALMNGYLEEDGELWDSRGTLVAMSRQLARVQRTS